MDRFSIQKEVVLSFEILLIIGVIGFYLYDSIMLLNINELILTRSHKGWFYKFPILDFQLLRKYPLLPNPLTPDVAIFRTSWPREAQSVNEKELECFTQHLRPVQLIVDVLLLLLLIYLPVVSLIYGSGSKLLIIFAMIYLFIAVILKYIFDKKDELHLSKSNFASLAFESIACPPFALNMVRRISLNYPNLGDPVAFSKRTFGSDTQSHFDGDIKDAISKNMRFLEIDSPHYLELENYLNKVKEK